MQQQWAPSQPSIESPVHVMIEEVMDAGYSRASASEIVRLSLQQARARMATEERILRVRSQPYQQWLADSSPELTWNLPVHTLIASRLDEVTAGRITQLAIFCPPRLGKSQMVTVRYPVYWLEGHPRDRIIIGGYNRDLATEFARLSQAIFKARNPKVKFISEAEEEWITEAGGGVLAVGVGSGVTGRGADLMIIDDPTKPLPVDTLVPTPAGWSQMGNLEPGDKVFDHTGKPCTVTAVTHRFVGPRWRMTFSDGSTLDTHPDHPWAAIDRNSHSVYTNSHDEYAADWPTWRAGHRRQPISYTSTVTAEAMAQSLTARTTMRNWTIPNAFPLDLPDAELPIDPYVLGYWLGDGHKHDAIITVHKDDADNISEAIVEAGYHLRVRRFHNGGDTTYALRFATQPVSKNRWGDTFAKRLAAMGVLNNKHVPAIYLRASADQRLALLRGLMDSDGTCAAAGESEVRFCNTNPDLADAVAELLVSLGAKVTRRIVHPPVGKQAYMVAAHPAFNPFRLPRKANAFLEGGQIRRRGRTVVSIEDTGETCEHVCITVDSASHLFLAGRQMVPTHNSSEEAESPAYQRRAWNWWLNDMRTRRNQLARTPTILIQTRWSDLDLAGRILDQDAQRSRSDWNVVSLPAIAISGDVLGREPGESIWPERMPIEELSDLRIEMGSRFEALYQQDPAPAEGALIKESWFWYDLPNEEKVTARGRFWDLAASEVSRANGNPDYTVGVRMCMEHIVDKDYRYGIEDVARIRASTWDRDRYILETIHSDGPDVPQYFEETDDGDKSVTAYLRKQVDPGHIIIGVRPRRDKVVRSQGLRSVLQSGKCFLVRGRWVGEFTNELIRFPVGRHDDQVDAASGVYNELIKGARVTKVR